MNALVKLRNYAIGLWKQYVCQREQEQLELIQREQQCALDCELAQFADILNSAIDAIPANLNLNAQSGQAYPIEKVDNLKYIVKIFKRNIGEEFKPTTFHSILQPALNSAFSQVRAETEHSFRQEKARVNYAVERLNTYGTYVYEEELRQALEEYQYFLENHYHRLFGGTVLAYQDFPDCIVLLVRCEAVRIDVRIAI